MPSTTRGIANSGFQKGKATVILIHDFTSSGTTGWIKSLSEALLCTGDRNVIAVDWALGALPPFIQAVANSRVVGLEISALLRVLTATQGVDLAQVHLIGHGLGAHIAGYTGETVAGIGRISGLDPSGPQFQGMPSTVRLDPTDAAFVDVIHTDASETRDPNKEQAQGTLQLSGHVDFFPNGGVNQPGCKRASSPLMKVTRETVTPGNILPGCSHKRSFKYYIESIQSNSCLFLAYHCADGKTFDQGTCSNCGQRGSMCGVMGFQADVYKPMTAGKYYFKTSCTNPFCLNPYTIKIGLASVRVDKKKMEGYLTLAMVGQSGPPITLSLGKKVTVRDGEEFRKLAWHAPPLMSNISKVQLDWAYSSKCISCNGSIFVSKIVVTALAEKSKDKEITTELYCCDGAPHCEVRSDGSRVFVPCLLKSKQQQQQRQLQKYQQGHIQ